MAIEHSKCPSGKQSGGSLGSIRPGAMVAEFDQVQNPHPNPHPTPVAECDRATIRLHEQCHSLHANSTITLPHYKTSATRSTRTAGRCLACKWETRSPVAR
jgi:hypothetical protein